MFKIGYKETREVNKLAFLHYKHLDSCWIASVRLQKPGMVSYLLSNPRSAQRGIIINK